MSQVTVAPKNRVNKRAKAVKVAVNIICPHCDKSIEAPNNGSLMWTAEDFEDAPFDGHDAYAIHTIQEGGCGFAVKLPKNVWGAS